MFYDDVETLQKREKAKALVWKFESNCKLLDYKKINEQCILTIHRQYA